MQKIYLYIEKNNQIRKVAVDQPYLFAHKKLRLLKDYLEDGLFILHLNNNKNFERYYLTKDKINKEDEHHYYFNFPFKFEQVEGFEPAISN
jgi:hypothetical protein